MLPSRNSGGQCVNIEIIESDSRILNYLKAILTAGGHSVSVYDCAQRAVDDLRKNNHPDITFVASDLPEMHYVELIRQVHRFSPQTHIVVMCYVDRCPDLALAIREGASRILPEPFLAEDVLQMVAELATAREAAQDHRAMELQISSETCFVFASPAMHQLQQQAAMVARVNLPVLILGESGTGKEVIARYIHTSSPRAKNTFLKVNCAAMPSELLESELFGYEPGAFTGASRSKPGKFKLCDNGTMLLDEIGEMSANLQAKLLHVLQDGTFSPLGSRGTEKVNVRIIAATNIDMKSAIATRTFREDLYYRLNGFCVKLPPLRERREDVPVLIRHFLRRYSRELRIADAPSSLSSRLMKTCLLYHWPGNLRELESFVKRYLVLGDEQLMIEELKREIAEQNREVEITPEAMTNALRASGGNRREAARALHISYKILVRRLREYGMDTPARVPWIS